MCLPSILLFVTALCQPVTFGDAFPATDELTMMRDELRGKVLASLVKVGMPVEKALKVLGVPSTVAVSVHFGAVSYYSLGVVLIEKEGKVAAVKVYPPSNWWKREWRTGETSDQRGFR